MERKWIENNREDFERDVLREFCRASDMLFSQFERLAASGTISFPVLREMVGEPLNKGMLWRLKDKSHHLFRHDAGTDQVGVLLDWALGYIFHETLKLMEDAHQHQYYAPLLADIAVSRAPVHIKRMASDLLTIQGQTQDSISREARRLEALLAHSRALFTLYFGGRAGHRPLARLLYGKESLIKRAFGEDYPAFVTAIYGESPERLYHEAAVSLLAGGRDDAAKDALHKALAINPEFAPSLRLQQEQGLQSGL